MTTRWVQSKYNPYKVYPVYFLIILFVSQLLVFSNHSVFELILIYTVILFCSIYLFVFIKFTNSIKLYDDTIKINKDTFNIDDIESIDYGIKSDLTFPKDKLKECLVITFKAGAKFEFVNNRYSNLSFIKQYLYQVWASKIPFNPYRISLKEEDNSQSFLSYRRNPLLNSRYSLNVLVVAIIFTLMVYDFSSWSSLFVFIIICLGALFKNSNYFEVSNKLFRIRHYIFFWNKKLYPLESIREIVFEKNESSNLEVRIILNDFFEFNYISSSLSNQQCLDLMTNLRSQNVSIRNDIKHIEFNQPI